MMYDKPVPLNSSWAIRNGVIGGLIAGVLFQLAEQLAALVQTGMFWMPAQAFASIFLQQMPPNIPLGTAIPVGTFSNLLYSAIVGVIFALIIAAVPAIRQSKRNTILVSMVLGFLLQLISLYVLAPLANAPWFATDTDPFQQFLWHTFVYGLVLGLYLASRLPDTMMNRPTS